MVYKVVIPGRLEGLNEFIAANRTNARAGNKMKRDGQRICFYYIRHCLKNAKIREPVRLHYKFYEKDKRRDMDNVSGFAHKVFQDALVEAKYLRNDGWNDIVGFSDEFYVDPENPRIEIEIKGARKRK
jgi:Holliday junction resolvase RusA-like endonuclease